MKFRFVDDDDDELDSLAKKDAEAEELRTKEEFAAAFMKALRAAAPNEDLTPRRPVLVTPLFGVN